MENGGCCRHTASLLSRSVAVVDTDKRKVELSRIRHFLSEFHQKQLNSSTHVINYVSIDNDDFFVEGSNDGFPLNFYYGDEELAFPSFQDDSVINHYLLYNEKKNYDKVKRISVDRQLKILADYKKTVKLIDNNIDIVIELYMDNIPYMADIKDNYQKIYTKERKLRKWISK